MQSPGVVEAIDVVTNRLDGEVMSGPDVTVQQLLLEAFEEALGDSIVPAISLPAHAAESALRFERVAVGVACVLAPSVGVADEIRTFIAENDGKLKSKGE